jgi:hypothetical protein
LRPGDEEEGMNWVAVVAAAVAAAVVLSIYYAPPVMGDRWSNAVTGWTGQTREQLSGKLAARMLMWTASALVNATVLAYLLDRFEIGTVAGAFSVAIIVWLGFGATFSAWPVFFSNQPWSIWVINNIAYLLLQVVMAAVIALIGS